MPLAGGAADKAGNRYELKWVVRQFIKILTGEIAWIHLEPPGPMGDGVEFRLERADGRLEAHQAKRQNGMKGVWSVNDLARAGVLDAVRRHSVESEGDFRFISTQAVKVLSELAERARDAESLRDFEDHFLTAESAGDFDAFCAGIGQVERDTGLAALRHFRLEAQAESLLTDDISAFLSTLVDGNAETARDVLGAWALENTHRRLTAADIWAELAQRGFRPSNLANDIGLAASVMRCTDNYLRSQWSDIAGLTFPRMVAEAAVNQFAEGSKRTIFLVGSAGTGKTVVSGQIVAALRQRGWSVLALRMDRLDPTVRKEEIGRQLLGRTVSPAAALAAAAQGKDCLLTIEQLDAVSTVSGRSPESFHCVADIVREARSHPNMRVLLVCRAFDLENDRRFRELQNAEKQGCQTLTVGPFSPDEVQCALKHLKVNAEILGERQLELLRLPLHLALLAEICAESQGASLHFANPKGLFDAYWQAKQTATVTLLSNPNNFQIILDALCQEMTRRQTLSVPRKSVSAWSHDVHKLVSEGLLVERSGRIAFFHEGFFDYVFARNFCESGERLLSFLSSGDQDLFVRGPVRQILTYRRDQDFHAYMDDVDACINSSAIRFHLKKVLISVIGQARYPTWKEWEVLERCLNEETPGFAESARSALWSSAPWFRFLYEDGILTAWLEGQSDNFVSFAFNYIGHMAAQEPECAADLLKPLAGKSAETDLRIIGLLTWSEGTDANPALEALLFQILAKPGRDWQFRRQAFSAVGGYDGRRAPALAARALGLFLGMLAETSEATFSDDGIRDVFSDYSLKEIADKAPEELAKVVVPSLLKLLERHAEREGEDPPWADSLWCGGFRGLRYWGPETLLRFLAEALKRVAELAPYDHQQLVGQLFTSPFETAHALALRALAVPTAEAKTLTVDWLAASWRRYGIWYGEHALWDACQLLEVLASLLTEADIGHLEPLILKHWEKWEFSDWPCESDEERERRRCDWMKAHMEELGWCQHVLISALPMERLSGKGKRRRQELERKFTGRKLEKPVSSRGGAVVSPVKASAIEKMSNAQWLSALRRYSSDREREWLPDKVIGGAEQLAQVLGERVEAAPERFARLALRFPADTNSHYFDAVAMGLSGAELPLDLLADVVRLLHDRPERPHGRWTARVIAGSRKQNLPEDVLEIVAWYALQDDDPARDIWREESGSRTKMYGGDPHFHGINTVRGAAALAIADLISAGRRYWDFFQPAIDALVADKTVSVRCCAAEICSQALRHDRQRAVALFLRLVDADDAILTVRPVEEFLYYSGARDWPAMQPILQRMMASAEEKAREAGARQATLVALSEEDALPLAEYALAGDAAMRKGAADVLSHNLLTHREFCAPRLVPLFNDCEQAVRGAADDWIRTIQDRGALVDLLPLAEAYLDSTAFSDHPENYFWAIERVVDAPPSLLLRAAHSFMDYTGREAADIRTRHAATGDLVGKLVLRAYRQAEADRDLRLQCLDLFDRLVAHGTYGAERALESWERG